MKKRLYSCILTALMAAVFAGCGAIKVPDTDKASASEEISAGTTLKAEDSVGEQRDDGSSSEDRLYQCVNERYLFETEEAFIKAVHTKPGPDALTSLNEYYIPAKVPEGLALAEIVVGMRKVYDFKYHKEGIKNENEYGWIFGWNTNVFPEYLKEGFDNYSGDKECYKHYYILKDKTDWTIEWGQHGLSFGALVPADTPYEIIEQFCNAVRVPIEAKAPDLMNGKEFQVFPIMLQDSSLMDNLNSVPHSIEMILKECPTEQRGKSDKGLEYLIYELGDGYRAYILYGDFFVPGTQTQKGFGFIVGSELHSHKEFEALKIGDPIENVESIDIIAQTYRESFTNGWVPEMAARSAESGYPLTSIHYLSDGILKIEYEMQKDKSLVISNIVYAPDYVLVNPNGEGILHYIDPEDLPKA